MKKWSIVLGGISVGILGYAFVEPFRYRVKKYDLKHPRVPKDFEGFRIAFLADIHYGRLSKAKYLNKIVNRVNFFKPDIVLLGGDYITHKKYIEPCFNILEKLESKHGTYAVIGNHDVMESLEKTEYFMKKSGINSINNDSIWVERKNRIKIGGVGDLTTQKQNLVPTVHDLNKGDYAVLVTHNPKYIYQIKEDDCISLVLAGHTHGAQFSSMKHLEKVATDRMNQKTGLKYLTGKYNKGEMDIIVSNGVGTAKFPFRFFTPPEIIIIELHSH